MRRANQRGSARRVKWCSRIVANYAARGRLSHPISVVVVVIIMIALTLIVDGNCVVVVAAAAVGVVAIAPDASCLQILARLGNVLLRVRHLAQRARDEDLREDALVR